MCWNTKTKVVDLHLQEESSYKKMGKKKPNLVLNRNVSLVELYLSE